MTDRIIRDFRTVLELCSRGRLIENLDAKLADALEALARAPDDGASARIALTLTLTQTQERVEIKPKVELKLPAEKGFPSTPMFAADGGLSLQHPSQIEMFSGPRASPRDRASS